MTAIRDQILATSGVVSSSKVSSAISAFSTPWDPDSANSRKQPQSFRDLLQPEMHCGSWMVIRGISQISSIHDCCLPMRLEQMSPVPF
jgi:hypothetical protein